MSKVKVQKNKEDLTCKCRSILLVVVARLKLDETGGALSLMLGSTVQLAQ